MKTKVTKEVKALKRHMSNGHSAEKMVAWWIRLVGYAEIVDGKAKFYLYEPVRDGRGGWSINPSKQYVALEVDV